MTANAKNTYLRVERPSDAVVVLTLDDPDRRNAMSQEMTDAWVASIDELATDRSVRAVVVTGEGSAFCSGGITSWIAGEPDADVDELLTGRFVDAEEALRMGLVSRVFPSEDFMDQVLEVAAGIAATAPIASRYTTMALRDGGHADFESAVQWEALAQPITLATADLQEGIAAAKEKRLPRFTGR